MTSYQLIIEHKRDVFKHKKCVLNSHYKKHNYKTAFLNLEKQEKNELNTSLSEVKVKFICTSV